jgi:hypothetical protein
VNARRPAWHDVVTLDESWSYLSTDYEFDWLRRDEKVPKRERHTIQSEKCMLTIVWNRRGFHLIKVLEKGHKFNGGFYIAEILEPLSHCFNGDQSKQWAESENCWCIRTMCARIPPGYQLNILRRIG